MKFRSVISKVLNASEHLTKFPMTNFHPQYLKKKEQYCINVRYKFNYMKHGNILIYYKRSRAICNSKTFQLSLNTSIAVVYTYVRTIK